MAALGDVVRRWRWRPSSRFRRRACVGVVARQGRCVAEAGVRDAASCGRMQHAEAWVCPPASFPLPPFGSDSLSSVPLPPPGVPFVVRRLREACRDEGRMWVGVQVGATRRRDRSPPGRATRRHRRRCCRCRRADCYRSLRGLPHIEAAQRGGDHDGDSSAAGRLVVCQRQFGFGRRDTAALGRRAKSRGSRGLSAAAGSVGQTRNDEPKPVGKPDGLLAGLVIGTEPRSQHSRTPRPRRSHSATRGHRVWGWGATEHLEDEISITVPHGSAIRNREVSGERRGPIRVRERHPGDHAVGYCRRPFR